LIWAFRKLSVNEEIVQTIAKMKFPKFTGMLITRMLGFVVSAARTFQISENLV
jgi:hypothetical protein